jgi:hypothetical protein
MYEFRRGIKLLKALQRLLVIVPHRDARGILRKWSGRLFTAGFEGAWSFPWLVPLALLSLPFSAAELKSLALALREQSLAGGGEGKFKTGAAAETNFPESAADVPGARSLFGLLLEPGLRDLSFPESASGKILCRFSPVVLGSALLAGAGKTRSGVPLAEFPPPPALSFRAAAVANMTFRSLPSGDENYSREWETGKLCWLPPVRREKRFSARPDFHVPEGTEPCSGPGEVF